MTKPVVFPALMDALISPEMGLTGQNGDASVSVGTEMLAPQALGSASNPMALILS